MQDTFPQRPSGRPLTVCYVSIAMQLRFPRDTVFIRALERKGIRVLTCLESAPGLAKIWKIAQRLRQLRGSYDIVCVGYGSDMIVPSVRAVARAPVVYNASHSLYESVVLDRAQYSRYSLGALRYWLLDFLALHAASLVFLESAAQCEFISKTFFVPRGKLVALFTSADEEIFFPEPSVPKPEAFTVLFRGLLAPFLGIEHLLAAIERLKDRPDIRFVIHGRGPLKQFVERAIAERQLGAVSFGSRVLSNSEIRELMLACHVSLGQFGSHPRSERTIPNKTFESLMLGLPFVTTDSAANRELLTNGRDCLLMRPADPADLAEKIRMLADDPGLCRRLGVEARRLYERRLTPDVLGDAIVERVGELTGRR